ncbi:Amino acid ABC transporter substrate-binding protein [Candidatus Cyrtobacter comes]|uniref:Amino acid ABC transporter substrate-binding protein n=1 Tax=Candidatus Cyrtobacter comes TaxID=675776 RepID=A0ABU5L9E3_9RICK|nr:ABC transporter substrate-binding protein [Candidatus Cyrtobacter comes]MDZ5762741.1 Amino acid ABC transporter substrate-binding protein [Candidatus Cyrtobacter comes]
MGKFFSKLLIICSLTVTGCFDKPADDVAENPTIKFGVSCDYPPFTYLEDGKPVGFEIELAKLIASKLGQDPEFLDMQFSMIPTAIKSGKVDAGISCIGMTEERKQDFDFTDKYYDEEVGILYLKASHEDVDGDVMKILSHAKIGVQLGTVMEKNLDSAISKSAISNSEKISMDVINQLVESLKSGHVDFVLLDLFQAKFFAENNAELGYIVANDFATVGKDSGYRLILAKGSKYTQKINSIINKLNAEGKIGELLSISQAECSSRNQDIPCTNDDENCTEGVNLNDRLKENGGDVDATEPSEVSDSNILLQNSDNEDDNKRSLQN